MFIEVAAIGLSLSVRKEPDDFPHFSVARLNLLACTSREAVLPGQV